MIPSVVSAGVFFVLGAALALEGLRCGVYMRRNGVLETRGRDLIHIGCCAVGSMALISCALFLGR
jgi:hypothetical protein